MITFEELRIIARCGYCKKPMVDSVEPGIILLDMPATWEVPAWRNVESSDTMILKAVGILCDTCIRDRKHPTEAIEIRGETGKEEIVYHELGAQQNEPV